MRRGLTLCALAGLIAAGGVVAKTPQALKSDLAGILPSGKKARLAWSYGGSVLDYRSGTKIMVTESETGVIRELVPGTTGRSFGLLYHPHITFDGSRVIFTDWDNLVLWVINWDGTGLRQLGGGYGSDYYYDATSRTDWVVRNDGASFTSTLKRVNIDTTTKSVAVWTDNTIKGDADDGIGVSSDGRYMATFFNRNEATDLGPAVALIPNGSRTIAADFLQSTSNRGCVLSMAPDNHDFMHQMSPHVKIRTYNGDNGNMLNEYDITTPIITWATQNSKNNACGGEKEHDATRWASGDRNYVTSMMRFTTVNPFIIRLSDKAFIYIQDSTNCVTASDMDLRIADSWKDETPVSHVMRTALPQAQPVPARMYGINSRCIVAGKRNYRGVTIRMAPHGKGGQLVTVL